MMMSNHLLNKPWEERRIQGEGSIGPLANWKKWGREDEKGEIGQTTIKILAFLMPGGRWVAFFLLCPSPTLNSSLISEYAAGLEADVKEDQAVSYRDRRLLPRNTN